MQRDKQQQAAAKKVTLIGAVLDLVLGICKIIVGQLSHSTALIADGIHSLSDLLTDMMILIVFKVSGKGPDRDHPWGHGYFETLATTILGGILIAVAGAMAYEGLNQFSHQTGQITPEWPALLVAALSILGKEWIFRYTYAVGKKLNSDLLIANAWHSRTDAFSSIIVFVSVVGAMSGFLWLDSIATIAVAVLIAKVGWDLSWKSVKQLVNTALPEKDLERYRSVILAVNGVIDVHDMRTRMIADKKLLELHLQVSPSISASEGHFIGQKVCQQLREDNDIGHIIYHIDTHNDADPKIQAPHPVDLPSRQQLEPMICDALQSINQEIKLHQLTLLYHKASIDLQVLAYPFMRNHDEENAQTASQIATAIRHHIQAETEGAPWLGSVYFAEGEQG